MAFETPGFSFSLEAAADLSAEQHTFMVANASGEAAQAGAGVHTIGVLQNDPSAQGRAAAIMADGVSKVVAGAAGAAGANVTPDANGEAVTAGMGDVVAGIALEAAAAQGELIAVLLRSGGQLN